MVLVFWRRLVILRCRVSISLPPRSSHSATGRWIREGVRHWPGIPFSGEFMHIQVVMIMVTHLPYLWCRAIMVLSTCMAALLVYVLSRDPASLTTYHVSRTTLDDAVILGRLVRLEGRPWMMMMLRLSARV